MGRIIVTAIVFFFVWRFLNSFFKPRQETSPNSRHKSKPNQKVTVQYDRDKAKSKVGDDVGEYVEFEEIKEDKS